MIAGPIVSWVIGALETAVFVGGLSALSAGLVGMGIPKDSALKYETAIKADKFLLLVHGTADEVNRAKDILDQGKAIETHVHKELVAVQAK